MTDLTIIYLTNNQLGPRWTAFQLGHLLEAVGDYPIISISREPMELGKNLLDGGPFNSYWNIYFQMLRGARLAETQYVAVAEDDVLYTRAHFQEHRPPADAVAYDRSRWSLFTWDPMFCLRQRISNCSLVAPREYLIDALEERDAAWPQGAPNEITGEVGRDKVSDWLKVKRRNSVEWWSTGPIVQLNHPLGIEDRQKRQWKRHGQIRANEIPHWGRATDIVSHWDH